MTTTKCAPFSKPMALSPTAARAAKKPRRKSLPSLLGRLFLLGFFAARAAVGDKAMGLENGAHFVVVIALVYADVLAATEGRLWLFAGGAWAGCRDQLEGVG